MKIGDLFFEIGAKTGKFQAELNSAKAGTLAFGASVVGAGYAVEKMLSSSAKTGTMLYNLSQQSGIAVQKLDQLAIAANMSNASVSVEEAANSFARLNQLLLDIRNNGAANPFQSREWLQMTGGRGIVTDGKNVLQVMDDLRAVVSNMSPDMAAAALSTSKIFSPNMADFFRQSKDNFNSLGASVALNNEQVAALKQADQSLASISNSFERLKNSAMAKLAPTLKDITDQINGQSKGYGTISEQGTGSMIVKGLIDAGDVIGVGFTNIFGSEKAGKEAAQDWIKRHNQTSNSPTNKTDILSGLEKQYGLPGGILSAIEKAESGGDVNAVSPKGARGAFQFMPKTAAQYGVDVNDWQSSANGAARLLSDLSKHYDGDVNKMLAGYNFGQGRVDAGEPLPKETVDYIDKIKPNITQNNTFNIQSNADAQGVANAVVDRQGQALKQAHASISVGG